MKLLLPLLAACTGPGGESAATTEATCGDIDGSGGDTGNIPNLTGYWTASFAQDHFDDGICSVSNLDATSEGWISAMQIQGSVSSSFFLSYNSVPDERFWGAMDSGGGVTFTGQHAHSEGTMYAHFSGLFYHDKYTDRDVIDGAALLGMDTDNDTVLDCSVKGSWKAIRSGV